MIITLRDFEIKAIRKMMDEVFSKRQYAYRGFTTLYFEQGLNSFPNMQSTAYVNVINFEDILSEIENR